MLVFRRRGMAATSNPMPTGRAAEKQEQKEAAFLPTGNP
jgi:hypothetical protein